MSDDSLSTVGTISLLAFLAFALNQCTETVNGFTKPEIIETPVYMLPSLGVRFPDKEAPERVWAILRDPDIPKSFQNPVSFVFHPVPENQIIMHCGVERAWACQTESHGIPQVVIPDPCRYYNETGELYAGVVCHEMAHINGWRHPQ